MQRFLAGFSAVRNNEWAEKKIKTVSRVILKTKLNSAEVYEARRTLELSAELSVPRDSWRKQIPPMCGVVFNAFRHACHRH